MRLVRKPPGGGWRERALEQTATPRKPARARARQPNRAGFSPEPLRLPRETRSLHARCGYFGKLPKARNPKGFRSKITRLCAKLVFRSFFAHRSVSNRAFKVVSSCVQIALGKSCCEFFRHAQSLWYHVTRCESGIGMWLSLVERCVRDAEAAGSNPVIPTTKNNRPGLRKLWPFRFRTTL